MLLSRGACCDVQRPAVGLLRAVHGHVTGECFPSNHSRGRWLRFVPATPSALAHPGRLRHLPGAPPGERGGWSGAIGTDVETTLIRLLFKCSWAEHFGIGASMGEARILGKVL